MKKIIYAVILMALTSCGHQHELSEVAEVKATCTENGYTLHTCQKCGATMKDSIVEASGHVAGEWVVDTEATADADGLKVLRCSDCGEQLDSMVIPMCKEV